MDANDTIAAIATPPGPGALALLRVGGSGALAAAAAVLRRQPLSLAPRQALRAAAHDEAGVIDEVVALYYPARRSPTGADLVELTCHGSPYIQRRLLAALLSAGARPARPGEFTQTTFLNGRMDLAQAEAVCDLIRAQTELAHRAALSQLGGGLSRAVAGLRAPVLDLLVRIEAGLDHPEEDLPALKPAEAEAALSDLALPVERLARTFGTGRILREGARVCIVGRPNAGKSSLLNALLGCERAIVTPEPGTTRDTIEEPCVLAGLPVVLVDTAGLGNPARGAAEAASLRRAEDALAASDLALLVVDSSLPSSAGDVPAQEQVRQASLRDGRPLITVHSKVDLPQVDVRPPADCQVSALSGEGLDGLRRLIMERLAPDAGAPREGVFVTSQRHHEALRRCAAQLREAAQSVSRQTGCWEELAARGLREALAALDEIAGPAAPDEVQHQIFSRFCVGK